MDTRGLIRGRRWLSSAVACAAIVALLFLSATPILAAGPLHLSDGGVTPAAGHAGDPFTFAVTYRSQDDVAPATVLLSLDGPTRAMRPSNPSDTDYRDGARFTLTLELAAGSHAWSFSATDGKGRNVDLPGARLNVLPAPTPRPTPRPTSRPTSAPTPRPTARPTALPTSQPTPAPTRPPTQSEATATASPTPTAGPVTPTAGPTPGPTSSPSSSPSPSPSPSPVPAAAGTGLGGGEDGGATAAGGPAGGGIERLTGKLPPFGSPAFVALMIRTFTASTTATAATAMALFIFKRRREREEDEAPPVEPSPYEIPRDDPMVTLHAADEVGAPVDPEALMPRWRRPSLRAARLSRPGVSIEAVEAERLTFDGDPAPGEGALERRRIGYRMVRLGDGPDEILSNEIGRLDEGDEVELLQRSGVYWQVRTPLGQVGWVHKTTLGDPVDAVPRLPAVAPDEDPDVLQAFHETQLRRLALGSEAPLGEGLASRLIRERLEGGRAD